MFIYKIDVLDTLKELGYNTYVLRQKNILKEYQVQDLRKGKVGSKDVIGKLCDLLNLPVGELIEWIPDEREKEN